MRDEREGGTEPDGSARTESDDAIVGRVLSGQRDAFALLVRRYERYVLSIVSRHVRQHEIEETAQEVFVHAFQSLPSYEARSPFKFWLSTIAVRRCYERWRTRSREQVELSESVLSGEVRDWVERVSGAAAVQRFEAEQDRRHARVVLDWALSRLSAEDRMVLTLVHLEERPVREAAAILGWSMANVKVRAFRARRQLRELLRKVCEEE